MFLQEIKEAHSILFSEGKEENGRSVLFATVGAGLLRIAIHAGNIGMKVAIWNEIGWYGICWIALVYAYLLWRAPFILRRRDADGYKARIKQLDDFIGSKDIGWTIGEELGKVDHSYFFHGLAYNNDTAVEDAKVYISNLKNEDTGKVIADHDICLFRRGNGKGGFNLTTRGVIEFDIAIAQFYPNTGKSSCFFIGYVEENNQTPQVDPGIYSLTLKLRGLNSFGRDYFLKIKVNEGNGPKYFEILERREEKYPLTNV